ncbi:CRISPR-associated endonuclease Cas1 [Tunicatimonas pelagia]|uniref:CRISPR-associated endonuclease Cas1 n=1 Tax=Tunicatimonas pelagia TaxID=931531 RepID=UPI0026652785|nr:CRISPR-associated endonuclease Cas1 [Tunicatimonas pelagia]WKN44264.1 CRISPR-associated endonuclease Cas1 [Tunicatimonas pelagia]
MQLHINTYGAYVHVKDQMFEIRVPDEKKTAKSHLAAHKVKSIIMATGTALSTDAIKLAMMHNVDILFIEQYGKPIGRVWHSKLGSTTKIRKAQLVASMNVTGVKWVKEWVLTKVDNQIQFIKDLRKHRKQHHEFMDEKIGQIENLYLSIQELQGEVVSDIADTLRGLEGTSGRLYFETLSKLLAKEYQFAGRSSRPAQNPFNAFLNYAYGMLYGKVERTLILAGLDPYLGFLHRDDYNQLSFVFDFIEPYRIYAETVVFRLFSAKKVNQGHTDKITKGYSLNQEGKQLLVTAFNDYTEEATIRYRGRNQTRSNAMLMDARTFANSLIAPVVENTIK